MFKLKGHQDDQVKGHQVDQVSTFSVVSVDPVENVETSVRPEREQVVRGDGLSFTGFLKKKNEINIFVQVLSLKLFPSSVSIFMLNYFQKNCF